MSRYTSYTRIGVPWLAVLVASIGCLTLAPHAGAGINPLKKAKEAITKPAQKKAPPAEQSDEQVVFDEVVVELTNSRIEAILSACRKAAEAAAGRPPLAEKLNKTSDERGKLDEKQGEAVRELQRKRGDVEICYHDGYNEFADKRRQEYVAKATTTDPALIQKLTRLAQEQAMAQARGDSASLQKANDALMRMMALTKDDSLKVRQNCGPIPPHSAAEDQLNALDKQIASLNEQIRRIDENVAKEQAKAGGLNQEQWGVARERILSYLAAARSKSSDAAPEPRGFTDDELDAMEKHLEQLRGAQSSGCL